MQQLVDRAGGVSLRTLFADSRFLGSPDIRITSCCSQWEHCRPGDLFVAILDAEQDGHDVVQRAVERGATAVLAERPLPIAVPTCIVPDTREAYGRLCQRLAGQPSDHLRLIGVTGSSGKTITSRLIASVLAAAEQRVGCMTTIDYTDATDTLPARQTTPGSAELAQWLGRMAAHGCSSGVVEVSSQALAQRRLAGVELDGAVITNVRREHLDEHGSVLNYRRIKGRLFEHLKPDGFAVLNADDPASRFFVPKLSCPLITFGIRNQAELTASVVERQAGEQVFLLTAGHETAAVCSRMLGDHHLYNCLAAAAVGLVLGLDLTTIVRGLEAVVRVPGRLERIDCGQPFGVYVDYARTPDTLAVSLKALRQVTAGRVICVYGSCGEREQQKRPLLGRVAERHADLGIVTSDNPRREPPLQIVHDVLDGYDRPARAHVLPDRARAIAWALSQAGPDDAVLIAGKGHEDYQETGTRRQGFDDREIARNWLYHQAAGSGEAPGCQEVLP